MTPLDVLRESFESRNWDMWDVEADKRATQFDAALADVEKLVKAARSVVRTWNMSGICLTLDQYDDLEVAMRPFAKDDK